MGKVIVEVDASKVALPMGARATPRDFSASAVPASILTDVPVPERLGIAVTVFVPALFESPDALELDESSSPQATPVRARAPTSAAMDAFVLKDIVLSFFR